MVQVQQVVLHVRQVLVGRVLEDGWPRGWSLIGGSFSLFVLLFKLYQPVLSKVLEQHRREPRMRDSHVLCVRCDEAQVKCAPEAAVHLQTRQQTELQVNGALQILGHECVVVYSHDRGHLGLIQSDPVRLRPPEAKVASATHMVD